MSPNFQSFQTASALTQKIEERILKMKPNNGTIKEVIEFLAANKDSITKIRRIMLYRKDGSLTTCGLEDFAECAIASQGDIVLMLRERGYIPK